MTSELQGEARGARWRALLEARWQARLRELTELSLAYHVALAATADQPETRALLRRAVTARRKLADVEEALARLTAGEFGRCEQCGAQIQDHLLMTTPEIRYCARCDAEPSWIRPLAGRTAR
jgi:RNA polymerase-binding transcription factor DksA